MACQINSKKKQCRSKKSTFLEFCKFKKFKQTKKQHNKAATATVCPRNLIVPSLDLALSWTPKLEAAEGAGVGLLVAGDLLVSGDLLVVVVVVLVAAGEGEGEATADLLAAGRNKSEIGKRPDLTVALTSYWTA